MIIVGLTGGIGSGKTTVAGLFKELGVPVYIADDEAKKLMNTSKVLVKKIKKLFGEQAYNAEGLNRPFIAKQIFKEKTLLEKMNAIVHPKVGKHFKRWVEKQKTPYVIKEAAILFESGSYKDCNIVITVVADELIRMQRVAKRDNTSMDSIKAIMNNQWKDAERIKRSDFVIENTDLNITKLQVFKIHHTILKSIS